MTGDNRSCNPTFRCVAEGIGGMDALEVPLGAGFGAAWGAAFGMTWGLDVEEEETSAAAAVE